MIINLYFFLFRFPARPNVNRLSCITQQACRSVPTRQACEYEDVLREDNIQLYYEFMTNKPCNIPKTKRMD